LTAGDRFLLPDAGLVSEPDLYRLPAYSSCDLLQAGGENFLKASMVSEP
jgi:hypothetical protein